MSKILIVEDEVSIAELEKDYLELSGFEVEIENDGRSGLKRALEEEFDLFILDLMLPEVDGFEICKKIRETKNTPIIMISAKFSMMWNTLPKTRCTIWKRLCTMCMRVCRKKNLLPKAIIKNLTVFFLLM